MKRLATILNIFFCVTIFCNGHTNAEIANQNHKQAVLTKLISVKNSIEEIRWQSVPYEQKMMKLKQNELEINNIENRINELGLGMDNEIRNGLKETKMAYSKTKAALISDNKQRILRDRLFQIKESLQKLLRGNAPKLQKSRQLNEYEREIRNIEIRFNELDLDNIGAYADKPMGTALANFLKTLSIKNVLLEIVGLIEVLRNKLGEQDFQGNSTTIDVH